MGWFLIASAAATALAAAVAFAAIRANGPAVLDAIDRLSGGSRDVTLVASASYGPDPSQKLRIYAPQREARQARPLPLLVFVHGGSWRSGDPEDYGFVARAFAPGGFVVVLAGYRLGEAGRYPAMLEDTASAIAETLRLAPRYGGDPDRLVLAGHSAGAYNVVQLVLERRLMEAAGVPAEAVRGVIGLSGPYDFYPFESESTRAAFGAVGAGAGSQPLRHARQDAPPMLLIHGEADTLVKPRNTRALAGALAANGAQAETLFYADFDHNAPLISLASPWRNRRPLSERITRWAQDRVAVSVPVQAASP